MLVNDIYVFKSVTVLNELKEKKRKIDQEYQ